MQISHSLELLERGAAGGPERREGFEMLDGRRSAAGEREREGERERGGDTIFEISTRGDCGGKQIVRSKCFPEKKTPKT